MKKIFNKKHADWFMGADEAKRHGMVNHLRLPSMRIAVDVSIELE